MKLSIIVPIYNVRNYISECLDSIKDAIGSYDTQVEVILIDDGSPDDSGKIADEYVSKYSYFRVIHKENEGVAAARNDGIREASGEYVWFVDSDDMLLKDSVDEIFQSIKKAPKADVLIFDAFELRKDSVREWNHPELGKYLESKENSLYLSAATLYYPIIKATLPIAAPWDKIFRREFLKVNELWFDSKLKVLDDMVFNYEVFSAGAEAACFNSKIYKYRRVNNSITNQFRPNRIEEDRIVWKKLRPLVLNVYVGENSEEVFLLHQAYYLRVIKSFGIACRLQLFNVENGNSFFCKLRMTKEVLYYWDYAEAFEKANYRYAEWKLKILIFFGRRKWVFGVYLLNLLQQAIMRTNR